jgi:hypothetical protein
MKKRVRYKWLPMVYNVSPLTGDTLIPIFYARRDKAEGGDYIPLFSLCCE